MSTDPRVETIRLLTSIDATMKQLLVALASEPKHDIVPESLLAGPYGDPEVKAKDPKDWTGDSMKGKRFSECPPGYLDMLADRYDYFAQKTDSDEKDRKYARLDGARARGWAARLRGGWVGPATSAPTEGEAPEW